MILHDLLRDTAEELGSLEDTEVKREAVTMHHNPTLRVCFYSRLV